MLWNPLNEKGSAWVYPSSKESEIGGALILLDFHRIL